MQGLLSLSSSGYAFRVQRAILKPYKGFKFAKVTRSKLILALRPKGVVGLVYKSDLLAASATEDGEEPAVNLLENVVLQEDGEYLAHYLTHPLEEQVCVNMR